MIEETNIIKELKQLKEKSNMPNEEKFLISLREKLSDHIAVHAVIGENIKTPWYSKLTFANAANVIFVPHVFVIPQKTLAIIFIFCLLAMSTVATASQNSLPGETLYPIKILTEDVRSSLAITPESKAIIQTSFTARRVEEVKEIMKKNEVSPEILNIALDNLHKNAADTAAIINEEHQKGTDIAELAKNINTALNKSADELTQIFDHKNNDLAEEESFLENKIEEAIKTDDQKEITLLNSKLDKTKNKRKTFKSTWEKSKEALSENAQKIKNQLRENDLENNDEIKLKDNDSEKKINDSQDKKKNEKLGPKSTDNDKNNEKNEKEELSDNESEEDADD